MDKMKLTPIEEKALEVTQAFAEAGNANATSIAAVYSNLVKTIFDTRKLLLEANQPETDKKAGK